MKAREMRKRNVGDTGEKIRHGLNPQDPSIQFDFTRVIFQLRVSLGSVYRPPYILSPSRRLRKFANSPSCYAIVAFLSRASRAS